MKTKQFNKRAHFKEKTIFKAEELEPDYPT